MGAKVTMVYCSDAQNAQKVYSGFAQYHDNICLLKADITQSNDRMRIIEETLKSFKKINVLVNNAGVAPKASFLNETEEAYDFILDINLKAPIFLAQLVAKQMIKQKKGGSIINLASISGHRGAGATSYDAAKAGMIRATQTMANTLGKHAIRVNSISPGTIKTEMNRYHWENETDLYKSLIAATSLQKAGEAAEIAGTVIYLASDQSSFTSGADILVDGVYLTSLPGR